MRVFLSPWRLYFWGGIALLLPILGVRMAGVDAAWLSIVQMAPTIVLIAAVFVLVDIALSDPVPGAVDNASGVAAVLGAAERLRDDPPGNLDVWVVLTGAGECQAEGMRSFVREHRSNLDPETTAVVAVDSVGFGRLRYVESEGALIGLPADPALVSICEALGSEGEDAIEPVSSPVTGDAVAARVLRIPSITITGLDEDGMPSPSHHTDDDLPGRCDAAAVSRATDLLVSIAKLLDRDAARRVA
jgi:hypothetical protein